MRVKWFTDTARKLMLEGAQAAARMHMRGMPLDVSYCKSAQDDCLKQSVQLQVEAWETDGGRQWKSKYGASAALSNDNQLRDILQNVLHVEMPADAVTETGQLSTRAQVLDELCADSDLPLLNLVLKHRKLEKTANTFLAGLLREQVDGWVHPFFHVCGFEGGTNTVRTYRTSSSDPNFQNLPIRDPIMGKTIRSAIRAPKDYCVVEVDYSGIEVHSNTWYHKDPKMIEYLETGHDFHRDFTLELFHLEPREYDGIKPKPKALRGVTKNGFTFPMFYGSYWPQAAAGIWKQRRGITMANGDSVEAWLYRHGVKGLGRVLNDGSRRTAPEAGTFMAQVKRTEDALWKRFSRYAQWRVDWYRDYCRTGGFTTLTGFRHEGLFRRNEVINTPGQGTASQCKLQALVWLLQACDKRKIKGGPCGEIHDSIIGLVHKNDIDAYLELCLKCMVTDLKKAWPFIITPIGIEAEVSPAGGTWYEKAQRELPH